MTDRSTTGPSSAPAGPTIQPPAAPPQLPASSGQRPGEMSAPRCGDGTEGAGADRCRAERPGARGASSRPEPDAARAADRAGGPLAGERLLAVLQFADGLFPAGGFAHSFGLETYTSEGTVRDARGLAAFLRAHLELGAGPADAVAAAAAARAGRGSDLAACADVDARLDAMKWVPETRSASLQMGRQTARVAAALAADAFTRALERAVGEGATAGHHAVVFGAVLGAHGADDETAAAAYLHGTAVLLVNAALRLLPLGQIEGQQVLAGARPLIARLAREAARQDARAMWSFTPGLELAGLRHAALDMRLFRS